MRPPSLPLPKLRCLYIPSNFKRGSIHFLHLSLFVLSVASPRNILILSIMPVPQEIDQSMLGAGPSREINHAPVQHNPSLTQNEWTQRFLVRARALKPSTYITMDKLIENRPYVIRSMKKLHSKYGEAIEVSIYDEDSNVLLLSLPKRYSDSFDITFIQQYRDAGQIVIVILSQENSYHADLAQRLKNDILNQAARLKKIPHMYIVPRDLNYIGGWTVIPILPQLKRLHSSNALWFYFCEDLTVVNLNNLVNGLAKFNPKKHLWMGFAQVDQEPSIIHHFAFAENPKSFKYPLFRAGFVMTASFLSKLPPHEPESRSEFSIDPSHELAMYIGVNHPLKNESKIFCPKKGKNCGSYPSAQLPCEPQLAKEEIYFVVKTCHKYHDTRVPFVQKTWGSDAKYLEFFSDVHNESIPTTGVGINNTERGHCAKTMKILKLALSRISKNYRHVRWVVLADDDTILGVERLLSLLSCFQTDAVVGERYGYNVRGMGVGYNYPTGGGGIAFGVDTLSDVVQSCHCPAKDSPDDMVLGMCLSSLGIPLIHSPLFHQARPADYADSYLQLEKPISFHKHWNIDPLTVYQKWFTDTDSKLVHTEL